MTKEQVTDLHAHLVEHGVDVVSAADGKPHAVAAGRSPRRPRRSRST